MRGQRLRFAAIACTVGYVAVAVAIAATALYFRRDGAIAPVSVQARSTANDPLAAELARCQALGMAAKNDTACEAAWAANRRRFFTFRPADPQTATPPANHPPSASPKSE